MAANRDEEDYYLYILRSEYERLDGLIHMRISRSEYDQIEKQLGILHRQMKAIEPDPAERRRRIANGQRIGSARAGDSREALGKGLLSFAKSIAPKYTFRKNIRR